MHDVENDSNQEVVSEIREHICRESAWCNEPIKKSTFKIKWGLAHMIFNKVVSLTAADLEFGHEKIRHMC